MSLKGIDISYANGSFDVQAAIKQGAKFVIIRMGYGGDYADQDDGQYDANVKKCEAAGMPYGVYLYSYALNTTQAKSEAQHALRLLKQAGSRFQYGIWFDMEDADGYKQRNGMPGNSTLVDICNTFCTEVSAAGYETGIYASASWLKNQLNSTKLSGWPKWVAHWGVSTPGYTDNMVLWQYAAPANNEATPTAYDWNISYKEFGKESDSLSRVLKTGQNQITNGYGGSHGGIDLVKKTNELDTIIAHSPGTVVMVQKGYSNDTGATGNASYGNLVKIKHTNGYFTLYAHLDSVSINTGDVVAKGQTIGTMGNTGNSYGAHLHFEVRNVSDVRIDPTPYINGDLPNPKTETEVEDMTKAETQALIDSTVAPLKTQLAAANTELTGLKKTYGYIEDVPAWYRDAVQYYMDKGVIKGKEIKNGKAFIDLTATECRMITMMYRAETDIVTE